MSRFTVYIRDHALNIVGECDTYTALTAIPRHVDVGTWTLDLDAGTDQAAALQTVGAGVLIYVDGAPDPVMSGPVTGLSKTWSATDPGAGTLTVSGVSDETWLARELAYPVPTQTASSQATGAYDKRTGAAETVLLAYIAANLGVAAADSRALAGLTLGADLARGPTVVYSARFDNLLKVAQTVAATLGFHLVQTAPGVLSLRVFIPRDLSAGVQFSRDVENLQSYAYAETAPAATWAVTGGGGVGVDRTFRAHGNPASLARWGRIATFIDQRQTTDSVELDKAIDDAIGVDASQTALTAGAVDTDAVQFGRDYGLGDTVTVVVDGDPIPDIVRAVTLTADGSTGEHYAVPTVGTWDAPTVGNPIPSVYTALRKLDRRLQNVETRQ